MPSTRLLTLRTDSFALARAHIHPNALPMPIQRLANNLQRMNLGQAVIQLYKQVPSSLSGLLKLSQHR